MGIANRRIKTRRPLPANSECRWFTYALAAGAGLATGAQPAKAAIDYTPMHRFLQVPDILPIDLNHDGNFDFQIAVGTSQFAENAAYAEVFPGVNGQAASVVGNEWPFHPFAAALPAGARIGPADHFEDIVQDRQAFLGYNHSGQWVNVMHRYLGLRFTIHGQTHYGWIELSVRAGIQGGLGHAYAAEVEGYAYETTPDLGIVAGAGAPAGRRTSQRAATPDVLALGSRGLDIWRKRPACPLEEAETARP